MPHVGTFLQSQQYSLELAGAGGSVTIITVRRDRISEVEALPAVLAGNNRSIASGVARFIVHVTPVRGGSQFIKMVQGTVGIEQNCTEDTTFTIDVS